MFKITPISEFAEASAMKFAHLLILDRFHGLGFVNLYGVVVEEHLLGGGLVDGDLGSGAMVWLYVFHLLQASRAKK